MSVLDGPGEGTWSVFAMKVVEQRDAAIARAERAEAALAISLRASKSLQDQVKELREALAVLIEAALTCEHTVVLAAVNVARAALAKVEEA